MSEEQKKPPYFPVELPSLPLFSPTSQPVQFQFPRLQSHPSWCPSASLQPLLSGSEISPYVFNSSSVYPAFTGIPLDFSIGNLTTDSYQAPNVQFPSQQSSLFEPLFPSSIETLQWLESDRQEYEQVISYFHLAKLRLMLSRIKLKLLESEINTEIFRIRATEIKSYLDTRNRPPPSQNNILESELVSIPAQLPLPSNGAISQSLSETAISPDPSAREAASLDIKPIPTTVKLKRKKPGSVERETEENQKRIKTGEIKVVPQALESQTSTPARGAIPAANGTLSISYNPRFLNGRQDGASSPTSTSTQAESLCSASDSSPTPFIPIKPL